VHVLLRAAADRQHQNAEENKLCSEHFQTPVYQQV